MHSYQKSSAAMCGTSRNSTNEVFFVKSFSQKKFVKLISQKKKMYATKMQSVVSRQTPRNYILEAKNTPITLTN